MLCQNGLILLIYVDKFQLIRYDGGASTQLGYTSCGRQTEAGNVVVRVAISASFHDDPEICNSIDVRKLNKHKYTRVEAPGQAAVVAECQGQRERKLTTLKYGTKLTGNWSITSFYLQLQGVSYK